ncbi:hypothetical protein JW859_02785 [bacterium]|nr:hypothetical protein [bacterium]
MREVSQDYSSNLQQVSAQRKQAYDQVDIQQRRQMAVKQVSEQNKLAASTDCAELSGCQKTSQFNFSFSSEMSISWESSTQFNFSTPASFQSNFSFGFSVSSSFSVSLNEGIEMSEEQLSGSDFTFNRRGLLTLLEELIEKLGGEQQQQTQEIDLGGELSDDVLDVLEKLGLLNQDGQATPMLQFLSDYAGLNRFSTGQEVRAEASFSYSASFSAQQASWQSWAASNGGGGGGTAAGAGANTSVDVSSGVGGANTVAGNNIGGDVNIDDRDVINININNGAHDNTHSNVHNNTHSNVHSNEHSNVHGNVHNSNQE